MYALNLCVDPRHKLLFHGNCQEVLQILLSFAEHVDCP